MDFGGKGKGRGGEGREGETTKENKVREVVGCSFFGIGRDTKKGWGKAGEEYVGYVLLLLAV